MYNGRYVKSTLCRRVGAFVLVLASANGLHAEEPTKLIELAGSAITNIDLDAEFERMPAENKASLLFRKDQMGFMVSSLMLRRELAKQAEAQGLAQDDRAQAALRLAKERVLSEIYLAKFDESISLSPAALEQRAKEVYAADAKRFAIPAKVRASHILLLNGDGAKEKAQAVLDQIRAGKNFEDLAKENSADPGSAAKGGDLGMFGKGQMVKPFEDAAFSLKVGEVSDLVQSQFGYHIIKVTEFKDADKQPFQEVRDTLMKEIKQKIVVDGRTRLADEIISRAKSNPPALDAYIASQKTAN